MIAAEPDWLDLRAPFDDAARQYARPLLDKAAEALSVGPERPLVVIDIGAGTGNSMRWFDHHLRERLPGRSLHRVLVDADEAALDIAAQRFGTTVRTVAAPIASLPDIAATALAEASLEATQPSNLLITGSALLDVLTRDDMVAIAETLRRFSGIGLFLLSISGQWRLSPPHPNDEALDEAFGRHQSRQSRLGTQAAAALEEEAGRIGAQVESSDSPWHLEAPRDAEFLTRFLTERVDAAIDADPSLATIGQAWLAQRLNGVKAQGTVEEQSPVGTQSPVEAGGPGDRRPGLDVVVEHTDVLITPTFPDGEAADESHG